MTRHFSWLPPPYSNFRGPRKYLLKKNTVTAVATRTAMERGDPAGPAPGRTAAYEGVKVSSLATCLDPQIEPPEWARTTHAATKHDSSDGGVPKHVASHADAVGPAGGRKQGAEGWMEDVLDKKN